MILLTASAASSGAPTGVSFTLILIAVLVVIVIAAMLWGARQKSARSAAETEEAKRSDALLAHPQSQTAVSPAPPPLTDDVVAATPAAAAPKAKAPAAKASAKAATPKPRSAAKPAVKTAPAPTAKAPAKVPAPAKTLAAKPAAKPAVKPVAKASAAKPVAKTAAPKPAVNLPAAKAAPKPAAQAKPAAAPAAQYGLIDVKGLGPKAVPLLEAQGVRDLKALAGLSAARATEIDAGLGALSGRMARDQWIAQAKLLAAGDVTAFEKTYGKL